MNWLSAAPSKLPENAEMLLRSSAGLSPARQLSVTRIATMLLACSVTCGQAAEEWPIVVTADHSSECAQALSKGRQLEPAGGLAASFSMLNWNVEKARHHGLVTEFAAYAERSDLIFLQEAVPLKKAETVIAQSLYEAFVRGYVQNEIDTEIISYTSRYYLSVVRVCCNVILMLCIS